MSKNIVRSVNICFFCNRRSHVRGCSFHQGGVARMSICLVWVQEQNGGQRLAYEPWRSPMMQHPSMQSPPTRLPRLWLGFARSLAGAMWKSRACALCFSSCVSRDCVFSYVSLWNVFNVLGIPGRWKQAAELRRKPCSDLPGNWWPARSASLLKSV